MIHCSFCTNIFVWSKLKQLFMSVSVKVVNIFLCIPKQLLNITNRGLLAPCKLYTISAKGNCEEELPKKPVGRLSVNCRPTGYRQSTDS